jgi:predicted metal-binding protein
VLLKFFCNPLLRLIKPQFLGTATFQLLLFSDTGSCSRCNRCNNSDKVVLYQSNKFLISSILRRL